MFGFTKRNPKWRSYTEARGELKKYSRGAGTELPSLRSVLVSMSMLSARQKILVARSETVPDQPNVCQRRAVPQTLASQLPEQAERITEPTS